MSYIKKCKNGYDFKQMLKKYNLTVDQYFELRYEWDLLSGNDRMVVLKDGVEVSDKTYNFCPNRGASMIE